MKPTFHRMKRTFQQMKRTFQRLEQRHTVDGKLFLLAEKTKSVVSENISFALMMGRTRRFCNGTSSSAPFLCLSHCPEPVKDVFPAYIYYIIMCINIFFIFV